MAIHIVHIGTGNVGRLAPAELIENITASAARLGESYLEAAGIST